MYQQNLVSLKIPTPHHISNGPSPENGKKYPVRCVQPNLPNIVLKNAREVACA